jgi:MOSC domain-containing protein YiiM
MDAVAELERRWRASELATAGTIHLIVRRRAPGLHDQPGAAVLSPQHGVLGDRWGQTAARPLEAQVTLIERRVVALVAGDRSRWHLPGDNLVVDLDLSTAALPTGARLVAGDVVLEITAKPHAGCDKFRERFGDAALRWVNDRERRDRRLRGAHARVVAGGVLRRGDRLARG